MSFSFTCLEVNSLTPENVERVCLYAKRFKVRAIAYMGAEWNSYQFVDHSEWGVPPVDAAARVFMEDYQKTIREASERVSLHGLDFYLWRRELRLPEGFVEKYGVDWIDFENPELWELLRWNTRQLFELFPKTKGLFLSCTGEQKAGEWITANGVGGELPLWQRFEKMFRTVRDVCDELGREVVFRNHGVGDEGVPLIYDESTYMWHYLKAARELGEATTLMAKSVEPDYQASYPLNSVLGPMAQQQPTYIEFSLPMEYNAVGRTPFPMVEDIKMRLLRAREMGCRGAVARVDWHMSQHRTIHTWSCLDNFTEINVYAFCRLLNEPGLPVKTLFEDFARERFGVAASSAAVAIYKDLYEAGCKAYYELGTKGCRTPSGAPLPPKRHLISLRADHILRWSFSPLDYANQCRELEPDRHFIDRIIAEKDDAIAIYTRALRILEDAQADFKTEDYEAFHFSLTRAVDETTVRREYMASFFAWLAYHNTGEPVYLELAQRHLSALSPLVEAYAGRYDSLEAPDPDAEDRFQFGVNSRDSMQRLQEVLHADRAYWNTGEAAPLRASGSVDGAYEIVSGDLKLIVDPIKGNLVSIQIGNAADLLGSPLPLVGFRVGGLEETGVDVGRSYVTAQAKYLGDGLVETTLSFGCHSCEFVFLAAQNRGQIEIKCCFEHLPKGSIVELPWISKVSSQDAFDIQDQTDPESRLSVRDGLWDGSKVGEVSVLLTRSASSKHSIADRHELKDRSLKTTH
ncbi:hypothetical protein [Coraliomargarita parva]|uniref:hypothetical protein n=1 Tax=Coraliomargarita parva TaxID=3014050 RepID=UPI0022B5A97D|nr:hypothetical protein [Coraliomargarita parva]